MRIIRDFPIISDTPAVLTIGNFDGVHLGHRHLIEQVCQAAAAYPAPASVPVLKAAMTFEPHPLAVLRPQQPLARLAGRGDKMRLLAECGLDVLYITRFTRQLATMRAETFAKLLFNELNTCHLLVGANYRFGKNQQGDFALLEKTAAAAGAKASAIALLNSDDAPVSSGRVRSCLKNADFAAAAKLLGRPWQLRGRIMRGSARGRDWGFPTANLALSFTPPLRGIFAAHAEVDNQRYAAAVSIGTNPTISDNQPLRTEAHLLDFSGDIYGKIITLQLIHKIRDEQKYHSVQSLIAAIRDDVARTRQLVAI